MDETLIFDAKPYISSKRAAKLVGYTKDYVGQLCRGGKLEARLVGRSWYVSEDSIRKHKLGVHYTLHQPIKKRKTDVEAEEQVPVHIEQVPETVEAQAPQNDEKPVEYAKRLAVHEDEVEEPVLVHVVDEVAQESTDAAVPAPTRLSVQVAAPAPTPAMQPASTYAAAQATHSQDRTLASSEVRFHKGSPLFFEDSRPLNPEPNRVTRFNNVPIAPPQRSSPTPRPVEEGQSIVRYRAIQGGPVDGVLKGVAPNKNLTRFGPIDRDAAPAQRARPIAPPQERTAPAERPKPVSTRKANPNPHTPSKAMPVIAAIIVLLAILISYVIIQVPGISR